MSPYEIRYKEDGWPYTAQVPQTTRIRTIADMHAQMRLDDEVFDRCFAEQKKWYKDHPWYTRMKWYEWILVPLVILSAPFIFVFYKLKQLWDWLSKDDNGSGCAMILLGILTGISPGPSHRR